MPVMPTRMHDPVSDGPILLLTGFLHGQSVQFSAKPYYRSVPIPDHSYHTGSAYCFDDFVYAERAQERRNGSSGTLFLPAHLGAAVQVMTPSDHVPVETGKLFDEMHFFLLQVGGYWKSPPMAHYFTLALLPIAVKSGSPSKCMLI